MKQLKKNKLLNYINIIFTHLMKSILEMEPNQKRKAGAGSRKIKKNIIVDAYPDLMICMNRMIVLKSWHLPIGRRRRNRAGRLTYCEIVFDV